MRIDADQQAANAARLAGMLPPPSAMRERAARIAAEVAPAIASVLAQEIDELRRVRIKQEREESALMEACRRVGSALDSLEQALYTRGETLARMNLEKAARKLRRQLKLRALADV